MICLKKILVIEDDPTLGQNIRDALIAEQMTAEVIFDGLLAEKVLKKATYDCVILDVNLPGKNGYEICKSFRQTDKFTPVLFLTAFDELEDKVQGYASGADDYLTKPFYMRELVLKVQALVRRSDGARTAQPVIVSAGDIVIDTVQKKVQRQGIEVALTPREYQILLRLVQSKGELVPKKELISQIWGTSFDANTNTIEVYINFLRKKIDKPFGRDSIKTRVGYGYYFEE